MWEERAAQGGLMPQSLLQPSAPLHECQCPVMGEEQESLMPLRSQACCAAASPILGDPTQGVSLVAR